MAVFEYIAINGKGRQTKGVIDAESVRAARLKLKGQGLFPTSMTESDRAYARRGWNINLDFSQRRVSVTELSVSTRQLATLVGAGMPLVEALRALADQTDHPYFRKVLAEVSDKVNEGATLADSLRSYQKVFPRLFVNMIAAGEASGTLDLVLERLSDLLESQAILRRKIVSALTYPALMITLCLAVVILLLAYVVPQITVIFAEQHATLPLPTQIVIALSDFARKFWWIVILAIALIVIWARSYRRSAGGRLRIDSAKLKAPFFGALILKIATARFARNLGTMLESGVELLSALSIVKNIVGNVLLENAVEESITGVREGRDLAGELHKAHLFPRLLIHMIAIGERSGQLEGMLLRAASSYESEVNALVSGLTSIIEPLLILFLALIVGFIIASVMLPMLQMSTLAGL